MRNTQNKDCRDSQKGEAHPESQPSTVGMLKDHVTDDSMKGASGGGPKHQGGGGAKHASTGSKKDKY